MLYEVIMSVMMNICLLIVLAMLLTKVKFVQGMLLIREDEKDYFEKVKDQLILGAVFGVFCVISDYIGIQVQGAIPNARVIGVLASGFLGGPVSGLFTTLIAAVHRYMIFPERISTVACVISAILHGIMGACIGYAKRENRNYSNWFLLFTTFVAEAIHMLLILILTRPFTEAVLIVRIVIVPMVIINSFGMVIFFGVFKTIFNQEDAKVAKNVSLALSTADRCSPYLADAQVNPESIEQIIHIIMEEYQCVGVTLIKDYEFLGKSKVFDGIELNEASYPRLLKATKTYKTTRVSKNPLPEDAFYPLYERNVIFSAPIIKGEQDVMSLVMVIRKNAYSYRADQEFVTGLAKFFATQLKLAQMEMQKEELRKAEIQTLQTQINPHFLFNTLNTISYFCREKPEKARELLIALSYYFRNMLENIDYMVPLETELENVQAYIMLEQARFEDRLDITIELGKDIAVYKVPNLILQPIVENAIRHGAMKRKNGTVKITVERGEKTAQIQVEDNGPGMDHEMIDQLMRGERIGRTGQHGIGLFNVCRRLDSIYGMRAALQIKSTDSGTIVRMVIPN